MWLTKGLTAAKIEIKALSGQCDMFARQLEEVMAEMERLLVQITRTKAMLTVPSVAVVTLAGFLAKVGDLSGYEHGQQIIRAGRTESKRVQFWKDKGQVEHHRPKQQGFGPCCFGRWCYGSKEREVQGNATVLHEVKPKSTEEKAIPCGLVRETHTWPAYARDSAHSIRCKRRFRAGTSVPDSDGSLSKTEITFLTGRKEPGQRKHGAVAGIISIRETTL